MKNKIFFSFVIVLLFAGFFSLFLLVKKEKQPSDKIKIVTTLFPLYDMAKNIGGDKAEVFLLLPLGVEPHSFDPKPTDIVKINESDIFVYTGKFMEPWAEDVIRGIANKNLIIIDSGKNTKMISGVFHDMDEPTGSLDPHIWLNFDNAKIMTQNILEAFKIKDPSNQSYYEKNFEDYSNKLSEIDNSYKNSLATCKKNEIIYGGHYAFGYLANRYGLKYFTAQGVSPDAEPTANDLINLVKQIKNENIKYVFYEELTSPKIAETIASETNAKLLLLNAAHNITRDQFAAGASFFDILNNNLNNLKIGLECN